MKAQSDRRIQTEVSTIKWLVVAQKVFAGIT